MTNYRKAAERREQAKAIVPEGVSEYVRHSEQSFVGKWSQTARNIEQHKARANAQFKAVVDGGKAVSERIVFQATEASKHRAYEVGKQARTTGRDIKTFASNGFGYPKGQYFEWFRLGFYGDDFRSDLSDPAEMSYCERKARTLISQAYRDIGRHSKAEAVLKPEYQSMGLKAFAAYIESVE